MMTAALISLGVAVFVGLITVAVRAEARRLEKIKQGFAAVGRALGLEPVGHGGLCFGGKIEGLPARIERVGSAEGFWRTHVRIESDRIPRPLEIGRADGRTGVSRAIKGEDIQIGDASFDAVVHVAGPEDVSLAVLTGPTRDLLAAFLTKNGHLKDGVLTIDLVAEVPDEHSIEAIVGLAKALSVGPVPAALQANAAQDASPSVRRRNLEALLRHHAASKEARAASEAALEDPSPEVRLFAASNVEGAPSRDVLMALLADEGLKDDLRERALQGMVTAHPWPSVVAPVKKALFAKSGAVRRAAIRAIGKAKAHALAGDLAEMVSIAEDQTCEALAEALGNLGGDRVESALIEMLKTKDSDVARRAAIVALRKTGTVRAVEPLLAISKGPLAELARDTARAIQALLGDVEAGRLSVVDVGAAGGELSVAGEAAKVKDGA